MSDIFRPWASQEQIDIPTSGFKRSDAGLWRNDTPHPLVIDRILIDSEAVTTVSVRGGVRGRRPIVESFISTLALQNTLNLMNQAADGARPIWHFSRSVVVAPGQRFFVKLADTVNSADRAVTVAFYGRRACSPSQPVILQSLVTVPQNGEIVAAVDSDPADPVEIVAFGLWINESGTAAGLRGIEVTVSGGGLPAWSSMAIRGSLLFSDRNPAALTNWEPAPGGLVLQPGESLDFEFFDSSPTNTVYLGATGFALDRVS